MNPNIAGRLPTAFAACLLALTATMTLAAGPASAAVGCKGSACNHLDPRDEGCSSGASTLDDFSNDGTYVELRYSSACNAAWVRFTRSPGYILGNYGTCPDYVRIVASDDSGTTLRSYKKCIPYPTSSTITGWTAMNSFSDWVSACGYFNANDDFSACTRKW